MKKIAFLVVLAIGLSVSSFSQTTIILMRHTEKAAVTGEMSATDPDLSEAGLKRAESLVAALKDYKPEAFYSTNYIRTKKTIQPLADKFSKTIEVYDPRKLDEFASVLLKGQGNKTIIVAGHSNTTPALVNLLLKQNKYQPLDESVYNKIWIVTIQPDGTATDKQIEY